MSQYVVFGWIPRIRRFWAPRILVSTQNQERSSKIGTRQTHRTKTTERFPSEPGTIFFSQNSLWVPEPLEVVCGPNCPQDYPFHTHGGKTISIVQDGNMVPTTGLHGCHKTTEETTWAMSSAHKASALYPCFWPFSLKLAPGILLQPVSEKVLEHPCLVYTKKTPHDQVLLPYLYAGNPQLILEAWSHSQWWLALCSPSIVGLGTPEIHVYPHFLCCSDSSGAPCMVLLKIHLLLLTPVLHSLLTLHIPGKAWPSHITLTLLRALSWLVCPFVLAYLFPRKANPGRISQGLKAILSIFDVRKNPSFPLCATWLWLEKGQSLRRI